MTPQGDAHEELERAASLLAKRRLEECRALCSGVLRRDPDNAEALFLMGAAASEERDFAKAADLFGRAAAADPSAAKPHAHQARCFIALNRRAEARAAADRAADLGASDALTLDTIGVVYSRLGEHAFAAGFYRRAAALDPTRAQYQYNLAAALQFLGEFELAARAYEAAIRLRPDFYRAYSSLVMLERQSAEKNHIAALERLFDARDPTRALHVGHALAKTYEDLGDWDQSLAWLARAKAPKRAALAYDVDAERQTFAAAARTSQGARAGEGHGSQEPIFIVGLPRTGTTLLDRILSSHPEVTSAGELTSFALLVKQAAQTPSNLVLDADTLERGAARADFAALGLAYIESTRPLTGATPRFTDKTPLNFFYAGLIHRALPNARIICLRRDPVDSCLSNYRQLFATSFRYYNYALKLEDVGRYYALFARLIDHWREALPADRFCEARYEALVSDQETQTRRLLAFCGLDWDARCLDFHQNAAPVATASSVQVRSPLYSSSVGRWRRYGDGLAPLLRVLREEGLSPD